MDAGCPRNGHLIHGPQLAIDVWRTRDSKTILQLRKLLLGEFYRESSRLKEEGVTRKCVILAPADDRDEISGSNQFDRLFCVVVDPNEQNIYSVEFTACLILLEFSDLNTRSLRLLFNVFSRARVYCHIKIIVREFEGDAVQTENLKIFLGIFKGAKVNDQKYQP